jgi:hypothetical protein
MTEPQLTVRKHEVSSLLSAAFEFHERAECFRMAAVDSMRSSLFNAWQCGIRLNKLKALVGRHGHWQDWLESNFCKPHGVTYQTASLYMKIDKAHPHLRMPRNPKSSRVVLLNFGTIREFKFSFVPKRPLDGKQKSPRLPHIMVVNEWSRWKRRRDVGLIKPNPTEERRDFKAVFEWLRDNLFAD